LLRFPAVVSPDDGASDMPKTNSHKSIRSLDCQPGTAYNEETFLHLLAIERARADRANQRLRLLLVTVESAAGKAGEIPPAGASKLFDGLRLLLRETDIMGWYEQPRIAGAVLTAPNDAAGFEETSLIEQRVGDGLRKKLPASLARNLRVRVTQHGPRRLEKRKAAGARD
jgi:hypothetical protein